MSAANPFADNPFTQNGASRPAAPTGGAWGPGTSSGGTVPAYTGDVPAPAAAPAAAQPAAKLGGGKAAADLTKREAELNAREAELKRWEADLRQSGRLRPKKNWPRCCPVTTMDIKGEVPAELQGVVSAAYYSYLGLCVCLVYQLAAVVVALALMGTSKGRLSGFFLALIYALVGIPCAWALWYIRLYTAAIKDRAFAYLGFFLAYLVHIFWCIWSAVSPPILFNKWSYAGWITAFVSALPNKAVVGVIYIVGATLWTAEAFLSIYVLQSVYANFRGSKSEKRLRGDAAMLQAAASRV